MTEPLDSFKTETTQNPSEERFKRGSLEIISRRVTPKDPDPLMHILDDNSVEIIFNQNGKTLNLSELTPGGWRFVSEDYQIAAWWNNNEITLEDEVLLQAGKFSGFYPTPESLMKSHPFEKDGENIILEYHKFLATDGSAFVLLHEIGHAIDKEKGDFTERIDLDTKNGKKELSSDEKMEAAGPVFDSESSAWNHAYRLLRECRKKGIDLEPNLSDQDLARIVSYALGTYFLGFQT